MDKTLGGSAVPLKMRIGRICLHQPVICFIGQYFLLLRSSHDRDYTLTQLASVRNLFRGASGFSP